MDLGIGGIILHWILPSQHNNTMFSYRLFVVNVNILKKDQGNLDEYQK